MLITETLAEKWYRTDSWVYKNFSYLYQNKLWKKKIPNGYSVCPYFWLSLFSLFIIRPFVFVGNIVKIVLTSVFGKLFAPIDKAICKFGCLLVRDSYSARAYEPDTDYIVMARTILTGMILTCWSAAAYYLHKFDVNPHLDKLEHYFSYFGTVFLTIITIAFGMKIIAGYTNNTSLFKKSMKVMKSIPMLFVMWIVTSSIYFIIINHTAFVTALIRMLKSIGIICKDAWFTAYTLTVAVLMYNGLGVPLWMLLVGVAILAWVSSYGFVYLADKYDMSYTPAEKKVMQIEKWMDILLDIYTFKTKETIKDIRYILTFKNKYYIQAAEKLSRLIIKDALHTTYYASLAAIDLLKNPSIDDEIWSLDRVSRILKFQLDNPLAAIQELRYNFNGNLQLAIDKQQNEITRLAKQLKSIDEENNHRYDWVLVNPIYIKLVAIVNKCVVISNKIKNIVVSGYEQTTIFLSYMKMLVTAKKQKACPYFMFKTPMKVAPVIPAVTSKDIIPVAEPVKVKKTVKSKKINKAVKVAIKRTYKKKKK